MQREKLKQWFSNTRILLHLSSSTFFRCTILFQILGHTILFYRAASALIVSLPTALNISMGVYLPWFFVIWQWSLWSLIGHTSFSSENGFWTYYFLAKISVFNSVSNGFPSSFNFISHCPRRTHMSIPSLDLNVHVILLKISLILFFLLYSVGTAGLLLIALDYHNLCYLFL